MKNKTCFRLGIIDGIPIALGYIAVSFSLGIQAKSANISAFYATIMSLLNSTSAGEFLAITIIAANGPFSELAISQLIINLRYMLMSCSLSQKIDPNAPFFHRFIMAGGITDEIFGISSGVSGKLNPFYTYGAMSVAIPSWALGTCLGVVFGNILPQIIVNALSVALYGMFIAIFIPPAKKEKPVAFAVIISMIASYVFSIIPVLADISNGTKIIILTIVISLIFAILFPVDISENTDSKQSSEEQNT